MPQHRHTDATRVWGIVSSLPVPADCGSPDPLVFLVALPHDAFMCCFDVLGGSGIDTLSLRRLSHSTGTASCAAQWQLRCWRCPARTYRTQLRTARGLHYLYRFGKDKLQLAGDVVGCMRQRLQRPSARGSKGAQRPVRVPRLATSEGGAEGGASHATATSDPCEKTATVRYAVHDVHANTGRHGAWYSTQRKYRVTLRCA
jgi:hypothetical protein